MLKHKAELPDPEPRVDIAAIQRQRILGSGKPIKSRQLISLASGSLRLFLLFGLFLLGITLSVYIPPMGIFLLLLLTMAVLHT
jgi:hypothetical protein